jgi:DnaJ-class molecular chaperone
MSCANITDPCPKGALIPQTREEVCNKCGGTSILPCLACNQRGHLEVPLRGMSVASFNEYVVINGKFPTCRACGGTGTLRCPQCHGTGVNTLKYFNQNYHVRSQNTNQDGRPCCKMCSVSLCQ